MVRTSHRSWMDRLRTLISGVLGLQTAIAFWSPPTVHAANPETFSVGVRPSSNAPPAAVTDLLASANLAVEGEIALTWTAPQGNAGGVPIANQAVESYSVRYATFSVASLAGNTTAWWNHPATVNLDLSPPSYTPQSPGSLEGKTLTGLTPGVTYYFGLKSTSQSGIVSSIDTLAASPNSQAWAKSTLLVLAAPASLSGTADSTTQISWSWPLVSGATGYAIYTSGDVLLQTVDDPTNSWTETTLSTNTTVSRRIRSLNHNGPSPGYASATRATLAATPTTLAITGSNASSVSLSWSANGNPAGTLYLLERSLDGSAYSSLGATTATTATDSGLLSATTYYYRLKAQNNDNVDTAYTAAVSTMTTPSFSKPLPPNGLLPFVDNGQFTVTWHAVTLDTTYAATTVAQYRIDRYDTLDSTGPNRTLTVPASVLSFSESAAVPYFYRISAISSLGVVSDPSDYVDSNSTGNRYILAADDPTTRVVVPHEAAKELLQEFGSGGGDIELRLNRRSAEESGTTLRSYEVGAYLVQTGAALPVFSFSKPLVSVQLGYSAALGVSRNGAGRFANPLDQSSAGSIAQIVAVYWFNGQNYVRISDPILTSSQALAVTVRSLGIYQLRAARISNSFHLTQGSPYPRIITPNGAENRKVFFFFDNPTDEDVQGTIYDIRGAKVRELRVDGQSPTTTSIVWDGRDDNGAVVPSGVYLYKISAGSQKATGSLVVAR